MEEQFTRKYQAVIDQIGNHALMVLATSNHDIVSARTMSVVMIDQSFYQEERVEHSHFNIISGS